MNFFADAASHFGYLWMFATVAAALAMLRQYLAVSMVSTLAIFMNCMFAFLVVGGLLWPDYVKTWDSTVFLSGPHWAVPTLMWMWAAFHAPVDGPAGGK